MTDRTRRVVHVLNGPNLNLLGSREPATYGTSTLADVESGCRVTAADLGLGVDFKQTNHEGVLVDWLQEVGAAVADGHSVGAVLNPGGLTHTSVALRDAIAGARVPVIEVHLTNVHAREDFRRHSFITPVARGVIAGLGLRGYQLGIRALGEE